jgi:3',5'-cyclic AMP phosphodiesterase CpdA
LLIAHISDLHLNSFFNDSIYKKLKHLFRHLAEKKVDHLVVTGDLTDNASEKDLIILRSLLKKYGFLCGDKLSLIIGNHDIYGGIQKADEIFSFPARCESVDYDKKVLNFVSHFPEAFEDSIYISPKNFFPFAKIFNNILFVGVNSIARYSKFSNPFASNGEVSISQFNEIAELLKANGNNVEHKIILIHHHFNKIKGKALSSLGGLWQNIEKQTMKLRNKRRLFNLFKEFKVDLILHGHIHESKEYSRKGIRFLNAGATIKNDKEYSINYNLISVKKDKIDVEIVSLKSPVKESNGEFIENKTEIISVFKFS